MPRLADRDPPLPAFVSMSGALAAGLTPDQVRQRVRSGRWMRVSRGVYRTRPADRDLEQWDADRHAHAARAIAEVTARRGCLLGFATAAVVRDLPLWRPPGQKVALIAGPGGHNGGRDGVVIHRLELDRRDVCHEPVPMTSVVRTWFDVTRTGHLTDGLVLGDAALRAGAMTEADVQRLLASSLARRGVRTVREAARHLSSTRETALESASWAYFVRYGVPLPSMQVEIRRRDGRFVARVDFLWEEAGVVGEADGRLKYLTPAAIYAEKRREDEIRGEGFRVMRWGVADLLDDDLAVRLRRVLS